MWLEKYQSKKNEVFENLRDHKDKVLAVKGNLPVDLIIEAQCPEEQVTLRLCCVDGGEGISELLGAGVYFIRASGLIFEHGGENKFVRDLDIGVIDYDEHTKERVELLRAAMEFDVAIKCVENDSPDVVLIDGSLHVNYQKEQVECPEYENYARKFAKLLFVCRQRKIPIVGVSEDTQSRLFAKHLSAKYAVRFPRFMTDSAILRLLSDHDVYRTVSFNPSAASGSEDEITFHTAYLQPTKYSSPLRIDVPEWEPDFDKMIEMVLSLSKGSKNYGYPLPLYLAHLDAKIEQKHTDWSTQQLIHSVSKRDMGLYHAILKNKRRDTRPR